MSRLEAILVETRLAVSRRERELPAAELETRIDPSRPRRSFAGALSGPGISLIAEHKRRSPSAGAIREDLELADVVGAYDRGGAAALSILTDEAGFDGSLDDLREARLLTDLPLLRKDFIVGRYQLLEAADAGADAVLLIVAALDAAQLVALASQAEEMSLDVLVEVHDERELEVAVSAGADLIGINNRDLTDFSVDTERTFELLNLVPTGCTVVSESGISTADQLVQLEESGVDAVLVGEALMRSGDLADAVRKILSRT